VYQRLFPLYSRLYFGLGTRDAAPMPIGAVLPELRRIAADARQS
jgi:hypothetical protein